MNNTSTLQTTAPVVFAPVTKSVYVPPANAIFQPTSSFFSCLPLLSPSHQSFDSLLLSGTSMTSSSTVKHASSDEPGGSSHQSVSLLEQNHKRKNDHRYKAGRTGLSIFEKTFLKKQKLGLDFDSGYLEHASCYKKKKLLTLLMVHLMQQSNRQAALRGRSPAAQPKADS